MLKNFKKYILLGTILTIADQISKYIIFHLLTTKPFGSISILPFFDLTLVINKGVSFGFLNNIPHPEYIISFIVICIICFLCFLFIKETSEIKKTALVLLISGAIGNTIDRFIYGGVVDFLDFHIGSLHYPAFNIADSIIFMGVFTLLFPNIIKKILRLKSL